MFITTALALLSLSSGRIGRQDPATTRAASLVGRWGTYDEALTRTVGDPPVKRVDVPRLISELQDLGVNTYVYLIWQRSTDWDDLQSFLPAAQAAGIQVWVDVAPPSEQPPVLKHAYSEPYKTDYVEWGKEIARLSLRYPNLKAWVIDDFPIGDNHRLFTRSYIGQVLSEQRAVNPNLAFLPTVYDNDLTGSLWTWVKQFNGLVDGMLLVHNHQTDDVTQNQHRQLLEGDVAEVKSVFGSSFPVVSEQYTTRYAKYTQPSADTAHFLMKLGGSNADSVIAYLNPSPKSPIYGALKQAFREIAGGR